MRRPPRHADEVIVELGRRSRGLWPEGTTIGAVVRGEKVLIAHDDIVIEPDDLSGQGRWQPCNPRWVRQAAQINAFIYCLSVVWPGFTTRIT